VKARLILLRTSHPVMPREHEMRTSGWLGCLPGDEGASVSARVAASGSRVEISFMFASLLVLGFGAFRAWRRHR
jgi:hypothetical protein